MVASYGLELKTDLGAHLSDLAPRLHSLSKPPWCLNVCGEGGEYESFTLDCPLFHKRIVVRDSRVVVHSNEELNPTAYLHLTKLSLEDKPVDLVCTSAADLLSMKWRGSSTSVDGRNPFMTPSERLMNLPTKVLEEFASDYADLPVDDDGEDNLSPVVIMNSSAMLAAGSQSAIKGRPYLTPCYTGTACFTGDAADGVKEAFWGAIKTLQNHLIANGISLNHIIQCIVCLNQPMSADLYSALDEVYASVFSLPWENQTGVQESEEQRLFPPTRVCIAVSRPCEESQPGTDKEIVSVGIAAVVYPCSGQPPLSGGARGMHVRSLSHWAPASIGPYSQAISVTVNRAELSSTKVADGGPNEELSFSVYSGQIGMIPELMTLPSDGETECWLAVRHCHRVIKVVSPKLWQTLFVGICYGTSVTSLTQARQIFHKAVCSLWGRQHNDDLSREQNECFCTTRVIWALVSDLPMHAAVEWQTFTLSRLDASRHTSPIRFSTTTADVPNLTGAPLMLCIERCLGSTNFDGCVIPVVGFLNEKTVAAGVFFQY
ncbi:unnamed protein product [Calicophoron daubneyi]|uniref:Diphthine--ammonia ligase n=1 Tax=Calicophoron daubneyi TaxID=300641 RepID=A0AAV2T1T6_CALDB